jgi:hypothetical protein
VSILNIVFTPGRQRLLMLSPTKESGSVDPLIIRGGLLCAEVHS